MIYSLKRSESIKSMEMEMEKEGSKEDISCPSLVGDDYYSVDYFIEQVVGGEEEGEGMDEIPGYLKGAMEGEEEVAEEEGEEFTEEHLFAMTAEEEEGEGASAVIETTEIEEKKSELEGGPDKSQPPKESAEYESVDTIIEEPRKIMAYDDEDEKRLMEDLERLKAMQQEIPGEMDEEVEKYKCRLIAEMPLTDSQKIAIEEFKDKEEEEEKPEEEVIVIEEKSEEEEEAPEEQTAENIEIWIDKIPGIGPIVPDHLIKAVLEYMKNVSINQHNMVMPRNIRHYSCPPLEFIET